MPRRRQRKTKWRPQDERRLRVRAVRRDVPDARRLSRAFIGLALARAEAEVQAQAEAMAEAARDVAIAAGGHAGADPSDTEHGDDPL